MRAIEIGCEDLNAHLKEVPDGQRNGQEGADNADKRNDIQYDEACGQMLPRASIVEAGYEISKGNTKATRPHNRLHSYDNMGSTKRPTRSLL